MEKMIKLGINSRECLLLKSTLEIDISDLPENGVISHCSILSGLAKPILTYKPILD
jgi:hypothetical protein